MHRILVVDDDEFITEYLETLLKRGPYEVTAAKGPIEAYARYIDEHHDLLIVDLMMPFLDGYGLIDKIRAEGFNPKVLIITGAPHQVQSDKSYSDIEVLLKPFSDGSFLKTVAKVLEKS